MTTKLSSSKFDNMEIIEKKIHYLFGARLRNKNRIQNALKTQDRIRENHSQNTKWNSVLEIRKWRDLTRNF